MNVENTQYSMPHVMPWMKGVLSPSQSVVTTLVVLTGSLGLIGLHFAEPHLAITWSYGHLSRDAWRPWVAGALVVALPVLGLAAWRHPWGDRSLAPWPAGRVLAAWLATLAACVSFAACTTAPALIGDVQFLQERMADDAIIGRWHLLLVLYRAIVHALAGVAPTETVIRSINAVLGSVALVAIAGCARRLASNRREAIALATLVYSSLGVAQLCFGYSDVYPMPLALAALFCWLGLRVIDGDLHPAWPFAIAAVGPFVYLGLVLLAPSLIVVTACALRRPGGVRRIALAVAIAVTLAGLTTLPGFGVPFAFGRFLSASFDVGVANFGYSAHSYLLPVSRILSADHVRDVAHTLLLIDPVGCLLLLVPGTVVFGSRAFAADRARFLFLGLMLMGWAAFLATMDPVYGAYLDWDLFSYGALWTSLLGATALLRFGRRAGRMPGALVGLVVAAAAVHLLARLQAMDVDRELHMRESEPHLFQRLLPEASRAGPASRRPTGRSSRGRASASPTMPPASRRPVSGSGTTTSA